MVIGAVIITYNPKQDDLFLLVKSIEHSVKTIVIVDNGSLNIEMVRQVVSSSANSVLLELSSNMGIGYAQNKGITKVFEDVEAEGVILFDHDSHPEKDMIDGLKEGYRQLTAKGLKVGAVGPVFVDPRTNNVYPISVFSGFRLIKHYPETSSEPVEASFLIASGSLIPKQAIADIGLMNEVFFIDYIDIEWGFRAKAKGYQLFACPSARMYHQVGDRRLKVMGREISVHSPLRRYYLARNSVFMLKTRYINWRYKIREGFYSVSRVIVFLVFVDNRRTYLKYILQGWYDGLKGRSGPSTLLKK